MPRSKIISDSKIIRDWFEEVSGGCYVPNVWVDAMQELPQPIGTYCNPTCTQGPFGTPRRASPRGVTLCTALSRKPDTSS